MEQVVFNQLMTVLLAGTLAGIGFAVREWWRLATFNEQMSAFSMFLTCVEGSVFVAFVTAIWFAVSPAAAVATYFAPVALIVAKWLSAFVQRVGFAWHMRSLQSRVDRGAITKEEFARYAPQVKAKERIGK